MESSLSALAVSVDALEDAEPVQAKQDEDLAKSAHGGSSTAGWGTGIIWHDTPTITFGQIL